MKIQHLNTYNSGGAAIAARKIHDSLTEMGLDSNFYCINGDITATNSYFQFRYHYKSPIHIVPWVLRGLLLKYKKRYYFKNRPSKYDLFSPNILAKRSTLALQGSQPDILHLHWVARLFDFESFFDSIPDDLPIVWTLHDMHPFTGGCHYSWECNKYKTSNGCSRCPQLNYHRSENDFSAHGCVCYSDVFSWKSQIYFFIVVFAVSENAVMV